MGDDKPAITSIPRAPHPRSSLVHHKSSTHMEDRLSRVEEILSKIQVIEYSFKEIVTQLEMLLSTRQSRQRSLSPICERNSGIESRVPLLQDVFQTYAELPHR